MEKLFDTLDKKIGKENVLVYLMPTSYFNEPAEDTFKYRLPGGTFSVKRALSLLNAYLAAKYGNGAYVDEYAFNSIFLNKNILEEKGLDALKVAEESRDFLVRMSGVADAYTSNELMSPSLKDLEEQRLALDPKTSGDIIIVFNPGWKVMDDSRFPSITLDNKTTGYQYPGFIMGKEVKPKVVEETVEAAVIAPTLAKTLRIRAPNSAKAKSLNLQ